MIADFKLDTTSKRAVTIKLHRPRHIFKIVYLCLTQLSDGRILLFYQASESVKVTMRDYRFQMRGGGLGSRPIFKKCNEPYAPS